jgi:hypothetical protein
LSAIDALDEGCPTLVLPPRRDLEEFVFHHTAVQHWADAQVRQGVLTVRPTEEARRFWDHLDRVAQTSGS